MNPWEITWADYYDEMGLSSSASIQVIQAAYRAMAREFHPDTGRHPDGERMRRINVAHDVLTDPARRNTYDVAYRLRKLGSDQRGSYAENSTDARTSASSAASDTPRSKSTLAESSGHRRVVVNIVVAIVVVAIITITYLSFAGSEKSNSPNSATDRYARSAIAIAAKQGYPYCDTSGYQQAAELSILICSNGGNMYVRLFFFHVGEYLPIQIGGVRISFLWSLGDTIALNYPIYRYSDPTCCPTGGSGTVRFKWNGSKLVLLDPVPDQLQ